MTPESSSSAPSGASKVTHYDILEVPPSSTFEILKASYQRKARKLHPDKRCSLANQQERQNNETNNITRSESDLEEAFLRLQKAWECLRDTATRKDYDESLAIQNRHKTKSQALTLEDDLELVEDEDTGELCHVYMCRCGADLWLPPQNTDTDAETNTVSEETTTNSNQQRQPRDTKGEKNVYITCDGCSLVFHIEQQKK